MKKPEDKPNILKVERCTCGGQRYKNFMTNTKWCDSCDFEYMDPNQPLTKMINAMHKQ